MRILLRGEDRKRKHTARTLSKAAWRQGEGRPRGAIASWLRQPQPDVTKGLGSGDWLANRCCPYLLPFWLKTNDKPAPDLLANPFRRCVPPSVLIYSPGGNVFRNRSGGGEKFWSWRAVMIRVQGLRQTLQHGETASSDTPVGTGSTKGSTLNRSHPFDDQAAINGPAKPVLSGVLIRRAVVKGAGLFDRRKLGNDHAFDFRPFERHVPSVSGEDLDRVPFHRRTDFGPVGFQLRLVECLFANEHQECRHDYLRDVLDSAAIAVHACKDDFAGKPAGIVRGKKHHDFGDVRWRTDATQGRPSEELLLEVASRAQRSGGPCAFAESDSRVDGVHPDFSRGQFLRQHAGDGVEACFAGGVHRVAGRVRPSGTES